MSCPSRGASAFPRRSRLPLAASAASPARPLGGCARKRARRQARPVAGRSSRAFIRKRKAPRRPSVRAGGWGRVPSLSCRRSCLLLSLLLFPAPRSSGFPVRAPSRRPLCRRVWPRSRRPRPCWWVAPLAWMRSCGRPSLRRACACLPLRLSPGRAACRAALSPRAPSRSCARGRRVRAALLLPVRRVPRWCCAFFLFLFLFLWRGFRLLGVARFCGGLRRAVFRRSSVRRGCAVRLGFLLAGRLWRRGRRAYHSHKKRLIFLQTF